jgi:hypothetical protein
VKKQGGIHFLINCFRGLDSEKNAITPRKGFEDMQGTTPAFVGANLKTHWFFWEEPSHDIKNKISFC